MRVKHNIQLIAVVGVFVVLTMTPMMYLIERSGSRCC